jgi:hypothetical protein
MRDFAQRLIAYEARGNKSSGTNGRVRFGGVVEKLRGSLVTLSGAAGFRALLARALVLANPEVRWLRAVRVKADGSLETPAEMAQLDKAEIAQAEVVLVACLLRLLVTFIGEALTLRLVQDAWPGAPIKDFDSSQKSASTEEK